jgi:hypothetical protein
MRRNMCGVLIPYLLRQSLGHGDEVSIIDYRPLQFHVESTSNWRDTKWTSVTLHQTVEQIFQFNRSCSRVFGGNGLVRLNNLDRTWSTIHQLPCIVHLNFPHCTWNIRGLPCAMVMLSSAMSGSPRARCVAYFDRFQRRV